MNDGRVADHRWPRQAGLLSAVALAPLLGARPAATKGVLERTFEPTPPNSAYPSVWVGVQTTMTLRFAVGTQPDGDVETRFAADDGHGPSAAVVLARQVSAATWQGSFDLPEAGRWEGVHA